MEDSEISLRQMKDSLRATWMAGDFGVVAKMISGGAEAFVSGLGIAPGVRVLDVATGTGNLAIPMARGGADVTGVDIATNLLAQARARAVEESLAITFDEGDAEQMPYGDCSFDCVVTMFGAMFAPRPERVAAEMARVLKPGGRLAMANWTPGSFTGQMFKVGARYNTAPSRVPPPVLWGDEASVRERLAPFFDEIETKVVPIDFDLPMDAAGTVAFFRKNFGPTQVAFSRLDAAGQEAFAEELEGLYSRANVASEPGERTLIRNEYLRVTGRRR